MKYGNEPINVNGHTFASKAEARRYKELLIMEQVGAITSLRLQPKYELIPSFRKNGRTFRKTEYIADFEYIEDGKIIVEDVKGFKTEVYKLKKKLFEYKYETLTLREVKARK